MSQTHYYYVMNRAATERVVALTWNQFVKEFGWSYPPSQWETVGGFLSYGLDRPELPEEPTAKQLAPILRSRIRNTLVRMSPQYLALLELGYQMGAKSFVVADMDAQGLEDEVEALCLCAVRAFADNVIDEETLSAVLSIHQERSGDILEGAGSDAGADHRRKIAGVRKRLRKRRPLFAWQTRRSLEDGHGVLHEEDAGRFAGFLDLAWRKRFKFSQAGGATGTFRSLELGQRLHRVRDSLDGNCLVRYYGA